MLPPKSARKAVRRGCAKTLTSLSHTYASLMSAWITDSPASKELKTGLSARASSFRKDLAAVALQLQNLKETARGARWEGNVRGHWPYEEYNKLVDVQEEMVSVLAQVSRIFTLGRFPVMITNSSQVRSRNSTTNGDQVSCTTAKLSTRTSFVPLLVDLSPLYTPH
jgi:Aromatic acid exporter family member 2